MIAGEPRQLAVVGSPIAHSKSPALHRAAYGVLGLNWKYEAIEVSDHALAEFVNSRDESWHGLSLTMPLKRAVMPLLDRCEDLAVVTGSTNTVLFAHEDGQRVLSGFNTDVHGLAESFRQIGTRTLDTVHVLGSGATAASAIAAAALLSAKMATVFARDVARAEPLVSVGKALGIAVELQSFGNREKLFEGESPTAIISTLPGGTVLEGDFSEDTRRRSILFDVAYDPWPSALASSWLSAGGTVIPGIQMLINQALMQIRIFVGGTVTTPLPRENEVLAAMRAAVGV